MVGEKKRPVGSTDGAVRFHARTGVGLLACLRRTASCTVRAATPFSSWMISAALAAFLACRGGGSIGRDHSNGASGAHIHNNPFAPNTTHRTRIRNHVRRHTPLGGWGGGSVFVRKGRVDTEVEGEPSPAGKRKKRMKPLLPQLIGRQVREVQASVSVVSASKPRARHSYIHTPRSIL